jgi:hypothetical protein
VKILVLDGEKVRRDAEWRGAPLVVCAAGWLGDGGSLLVSAAARASVSSKPSLPESGLYESERERVGGGAEGERVLSALLLAGAGCVLSRIDWEVEEEEVWLLARVVAGCWCGDGWVGGGLVGELEGRGGNSPNGT